MRLNLVICVLLAGLAAGCASDKAARELQLATLQGSLPGVYRAEAANSKAALTILPVRARFVGENVYYLEWLASDTSAPEARLLSLESTQGDKVAQLSFEFVDPPRWRTAMATPELFVGLVPHDVRAAGRCDLEFEDEGKRLQYACGSVKLPMRRVR